MLTPSVVHVFFQKHLHEHQFGIGLKEVKLNQSYKFTPIIMLTTESQEEKKQEGRAAGAKAWVVKPFKPDQMLAAIEKLILR